MLIVIYVLLAVMTAGIAQKKGRNVYLWFFIGMLFGFFGFIASLMVSDKTVKPSVV